MFGIGMGEFILIVIVGLLVFGVDRLPEYGRSLAKLLREFRKAQSALTTALQEVENDTKPSVSVAKSSVTESIKPSENPVNATVSVDSDTNSKESSDSSVKTVEQLTTLINENPVKINKNVNLSKETGA